MTFNPSEIQINEVTDSQSAFDFIQWIQHVPDQLIGLDVETDGLDWYDGKLRLVQFGTLIDGWAVSFDENKGLVQEALAILTKREKFFVGHNMKFDLHFLDRHADWRPKSWRYIHDTMNMAAVISSSGAKALKDLSEYYVWSGAKIGQKKLEDDMKKGGWTWATVPVHLPSYWIYGVLDTIMTVHLFHILHRRATASGVLKAYDTEMAVQPVLYKIERKGMLLDGEHCRRMQDGLITRAAEIEQIVVQYGIENIASGPQIALAFQRAGIELTAKTETGKWKMDAETLDYIAATTPHPLVALVKEYRSANKNSSTYYGNFLAEQKSDGRCHPFYWATQARTGRMSAQNPAILTVPRSGTDPEMRNSFVAPDGHILVSTDFSNVEARVFAHYAQETGMLETLRAGGDLHAYTAKQIFQLDEEPDKDDPRRQIAKNCLFCVPESTKALTIDGPKAVNEIKVGDLVASYKSDGMIDWTPVRAVIRPGIQEVLTFGNGHRQFRATADHRWVAEKRVDHGNGGRFWERRFMTTTEFIQGNGDHRLVLAAQFDQEDRSNLTPQQAALLGWLITDGHVKWSDCTSGRTSQQRGRTIGVHGRIAQTKVIGRTHIQKELQEFIRSSTDTTFDIYPQVIRDLFEVTGLNRDYSNLSEVILRMGLEQVSEFMRACWLAEGTLAQNCISQNVGPKLDAIRLGCFMNGMFPGRLRTIPTTYPTSNVCKQFTLGNTRMTSARIDVTNKTVEPVWCIMTDHGTWVAVDGDDYFVTGNCTLFGGGPMKVAITAGVPLSEAEPAYRGLHAAFPGIKRFQHQSQKTAEFNYHTYGQAFVRGMDDRILSMVQSDDRYYAFTNWIIQGTACTLLKQRLAVIDNMGLGDYLIAAIHDEVVAEIPEEFETDYAMAIKDAMETDDQFDVPIVVATGKGAVRWGDAK